MAIGALRPAMMMLVIEANIVGGLGGHLSGGGAYWGGRVVRRAWIGAPDPTLTPTSGLLALSELVERLDVIDRLDAAIGPIKQRRRGQRRGSVGRARRRAAFGQGASWSGSTISGLIMPARQLTPVPGLCATTAAGLSRRLTRRSGAAIETGLGDVHTAALAALAAVTPRRAAALTESVTIDLDTPTWRSTAATSAGSRTTIRSAGASPTGHLGRHRRDSASR